MHRFVLRKPAVEEARLDLLFGLTRLFLASR
jgi:hypothetical protein